MELTSFLIWSFVCDWSQNCFAIYLFFLDREPTLLVWYWCNIKLTVCSRCFLFPLCLTLTLTTMLLLAGETKWGLIWFQRHRGFESVCRTCHTMQRARRTGLESAERAWKPPSVSHILLTFTITHNWPTYFSCACSEQQSQKVNKPLWISMQTYWQEEKAIS